MRLKMMTLRTLTAMVLFLFLAQANTWVDTSTHLVLAVGYRAFLVASPLFLIFGLGGGMKLAMGIGVLSTALCYYFINAWSLGAFALSMAVSGYIAKYVNAKSSQGAADNKVALNIGSMLSGCFLMVGATKNSLVLISLGALIVSFYLAANESFEGHGKESGGHSPALPKKIDFRALIGWSLIGIATGIKLTGIFVILPQYLIYRLGGVPTWFGSLIIINSLGVILFQHRIMKFLESVGDNMVLVFSLTAMTLLALPGLMQVHRLALGVTWILFLTIGECALSFYDKTARVAGYLLPKEIMVGVGSFITVYLSRHISGQIYLGGSVGVGCLLLGSLLTRSEMILRNSVWSLLERP